MPSPEEQSDPLDREERLRLLTAGRVTAQQLHPMASNSTFVVRLEGEDGRESLAVYKPCRGETPLWDFPEGTLHQREYVTYLVTQALGWDFVPTTVIRDGPYGIGSMQLYVEHDYQEHYFTLRERFTADFQRMCLFDWLANNADRKAGHCLVDADNHIWGIDHGLTFHPEPKLRTVIWDFADQPLPANLLEDLRGLQGRLASRDGLLKTLAGLLASREVAALEGRLDFILQHPTFPAPPDNRRAWPWPWL